MPAREICQDVSVHLRLPEPRMAEIQGTAEEEGRSKSDVIRRALVDQFVPRLQARERVAA